MNEKVKRALGIGIMGKDHDLIQTVKEQDTASLQKLLQKVGKLHNKNKIMGNNKKLNINFQDSDGMSALHQAALMGNTEVMHLLLDNGASTEIRDEKGMIPLHYAAWQGKSEPVHILLQHGSPVNLHAQSGETPMHLACQHGNFDVANLLLLHHGDPTVVNKENKTPLDLACEFGRYRVVELLLRNNLCLRLLEVNEKDLTDNNQTTCLHLAAKNGHADIITLLLQVGMDINRATLKGTCLHEASLYGKIEVVKLLLDCGIDVNKPNSYDQTALDIVNKFTSNKAAKELKHILKEASSACQARAVKDYFSIYDPQSLAFKEGDIITVLEQKPDGIWKGQIVQPGRMAKTGYFPSNHVVLVDSQTVSKQQESMQQSKPVGMPQVPDLLHRGQGYLPNGHGPHTPDDVFPPPPLQLHLTRGPMKEHSENASYSIQSAGSYTSGNHQHFGGKIVSHNGVAGDWLAGDMRAPSPAKDSPANSNRNSAASSDSGRGISTGHLEPKIHNLVTVQVNSQHRLSGQSYESGVSSRQSYHSTSSSSLGSLDRLEESGYASTINVAELFQAGLQDCEVMHAWLADLHFEEYYNNFHQAGYDMPTVSRMTPEDLTAVGITKPVHRKRLKAEIARLNIHDGIPDFRPNDLLEWLHLLGLGQYYETLAQQGYDEIDYVTDITWEDLEEIGIKKLGHQKKIMLAIDRLKRIMSSSKRLSAVDKKHGSQELLEPPPLNMRWSGDLGPNCDFGVGAKPKRSTSGDSLATISSGGSSGSAGSGDMHIALQRDTAPQQPDVVAIQVRRQGSRVSTSECLPEGKDMAGQPITYRSFQAPGHRKSDSMDNYSAGLATSEHGQGERTHIMVAPIVPKMNVKAKPVAKIIAKRSSREYSPDNIEVEKHEMECNSDGHKSAIVNNIVHSSPGGTLKKNSHIIQQQEHIYDKPHIGPPPKAPKPKPLVVPKPSVQFHNPGPASPLFVNTQHQDSGPLTPSPTGRSKKAAPPPPKRTNSIRSDVPTYPEDTSTNTPVIKVNSVDGQEARPSFRISSQASSPDPSKAAHNNNEVCVQEIAPQQKAFANCVQSLSEKFGKIREEKESGAQSNNSSDSEDFPPPPPPIAMDIITPKIHNYGIPSKGNATQDYGALKTNKLKRDVTHPHPTYSDRARGQTSCDSSSIDTSYGSYGKSYNSFDKSQPQSVEEKNVSVERTFGVQLRKHSSPPPKDIQKPNVKPENTTGHSDFKSDGISHHQPAKPDGPYPPKSSLSEKRSDSTASFDSNCSTSSVDSNTLPFANENVGTIKQKSPACKPSIVDSFEDIDGQKFFDLSPGLFDPNMSTMTPGGGVGYGTNCVLPHVSAIDHHGVELMARGYTSAKAGAVDAQSHHTAQKGTFRPPLPGKKPSLPSNSPPQQAVKPTPSVPKSEDTGDVLFDIDNMLQGLTDELDAMLEQEPS
ncbi:caskin-2-like [Gigantopelta aegis]|uniref:caskin-2-like n=1 Tax=Gigantopelta aegis TaxID=1735272 RepID=UPI001B88D768|nr:caskin-2-like [Gigantopelta aegis]